MDVFTISLGFRCFWACPSLASCSVASLPGSVNVDGRSTRLSADSSCLRRSFLQAWAFARTRVSLNVAGVFQRCVDHDWLELDDAAGCSPAERSRIGSIRSLTLRWAVPKAACGTSSISTALLHCQASTFALQHSDRPPPHSPAPRARSVADRRRSVSASSRPALPLGVPVVGRRRAAHVRTTR